LVAALLSVATNLPQAAAELAEQRLSPARQRILGSLLTELGTLLQKHANLAAELTWTGHANGS
jgi:hypothetical protein